MPSLLLPAHPWSLHLQSFLPDHTGRNRLTPAQHSSPADLPFYPTLQDSVESLLAQGPSLQITMLLLFPLPSLGASDSLSALQARSTDSLDGSGEGSVQPVPTTGGPGTKGKPGKR